MRENTRCDVDEPISTPTLSTTISSSPSSERPVLEKKTRPSCSSSAFVIAEATSRVLTRAQASAVIDPEDDDLVVNIPQFMDNDEGQTHNGPFTRSCCGSGMADSRRF